MIETYMKEFVAWAATTFKEATALSCSYKLEQEVNELQLEITFETSRENLTEEYVDCMMCVLDSANRTGISIDDLTKAFQQKLYKNMQRKWVKNIDNTYSHVKE